MKVLKLWLDRYTSSETMAVILVLWLCSLIAIGLIFTPWLGARAAGVAALGLLLLLLAMCWSICIVQLIRKGGKR